MKSRSIGGEADADALAPFAAAGAMPAVGAASEEAVVVPTLVAGPTDAACATGDAFGFGVAPKSSCPAPLGVGAALGGAGGGASNSSSKDRDVP
jgi:hypothetical protein